MNFILNKLLLQIAQSVLVRPKTWVLVLLLSVIPAALVSLNLTVKSSFMDLLSKETPSVKSMNAVMKTSPITTDLLIAVRLKENGDIERSLALMDRLKRALKVNKNLPEFDTISGSVDASYVDQHQAYFLPASELEAFKERITIAIDDEIISASGMGIVQADDNESLEDIANEIRQKTKRATTHQKKHIITDDGKWLIHWVLVKGFGTDLDLGRRVLGEVEQELKKVNRDHLQIQLAGTIAQVIGDETQIKEDVKVAGVLGLLAVIVVLFLSLRSLKALVVLTVPLLVGMAWTFAFAALAIGHLNLISSFMFSIISGLGIEYGIHLYHRYIEEREQNEAETIRILYTETGKSLFSSALVNVCVFAVLAFSSFKGFFEFGLIAAVGLVLTLVSMLLGVPAMLLLLKPKRRASDTSGKIRPRFVMVVGMAVGVITLLLSGFFVKHGIHFESDFQKLGMTHPVAEFNKYLREQPNALAGIGVIELPEKDIESATATINGLYPEYHVDSVHSFLPVEQQKKQEMLHEIQLQLDRIKPHLSDEKLDELKDVEVHLNARPVEKSDIPPLAMRRYTSHKPGHTLLYINAKEPLSSMDGYMAWAEKAKNIASKVNGSIMSEGWVTGNIFYIMKRDIPRVLMATLILVFVILFWDLRRLSHTVMTFMSVVLGLVGFLGFLSLTGAQLNFLNTSLFPVCVGISLDNAVHIVHRMMHTEKSEIQSAFYNTAKANLTSSVTNLLGFAMLILSHHLGLVSMGVFVVYGVMFTFMTTSILLPAGIFMVRNRGK